MKRGSRTSVAPYHGPLARAGDVQTEETVIPGIRRSLARARGPWYGVAALVALLLGVFAMAQTALDNTAPRFTYVDVILNTHDKPLAAYQFEFDGGRDCQIVGIEGGEHPAFANPPYYDPAAMQHERVIAAAYSTAADLPKGVTRVSRLMLRVIGKPAYRIRVVTAASTDGKPMPAEISIGEGDVK